MSLQVAIHHRTQYAFDRPVRLSPHVLRLRPAPHCRTPIASYSLHVAPEDHFIHWQQDPFGNFLARLVFPEPALELAIDVDLIADLTVINPFDFFLEESAEHYPFAYDAALARELAPYFEATPAGPLLERWLRGVSRERARTIDFLVDLNRRLAADIAYTIRLEPGVQSCEETLERASGSCRDSGYLLVQTLRHLGLAARFVSGYLIQVTPDEPPLEGPPGPAADFTDLHAWAEVFVPGAGWIGLDPTSGLFAGEGHIPLAATPDPASAAPVTGATDRCEVSFSYANEVRRISGSTSPVKPFSDAEWHEIASLGDAVDAALEHMDVRLTMGGEPTFVSIDDRESPEWTIDALGPVKRKLSEDLVRRLRERFAPGGMLHFGQGKWYPGELLPRWALTCAWRVDGVPVWRDPALIADASRPIGAGLEHARAFIELLALRLGLPMDLAIPGYEDALYYVWKEQTLPENVDPYAAQVDDPEERRRLAHVLERGLTAVTGYALPLRWRWNGRGGDWATSRWTFRRRRMVLKPGSSPMGYRLPLDSLPWLALELREPDHDRCAFAPLEDLHPDYADRARQRDALAMSARLHAIDPRPLDAPLAHGPGDMHGDGAGQRFGAADAETAPYAPDIARTALCVEPRDGTLYVFLPPLTHLEHYLDLVAAIESSAAELGMPVVVEGYDPPRDPRLLRLQVTPDPGVIEVNVHPVEGWRELVDVQTALYEEARSCRLGTERFMLDGRATGTGGGNHVTIGGPSPADSPVLRRPDLLRSLVTYWQHHPSLSYLLSGLFVGPTSQAPRVDEGRDEALYELEIALASTPAGEIAAPWLVDRLFRNLLVDVTGNLHRAEFCIDKLYSPDGPTGRLGLVEMRAFEMPPGPRLSLVQLLLLRALVARFWAEPYTGPLVRWGTELHDRFMLPHFLWQDFGDVLGELRERGYAFDPQWFAAFLDWRLPKLGSILVRDLELELRTAIEPWHVLGEEATGQGTARYVDSSVERLQVRVAGMTDGRHAITCNGRRVPLRPTGTRSEFVAGVRYRAWQPASALHPTIPVHAPLVFDVLDTWAGRSVGGCTYHVAHPGGRNYETFPVNGAEAEARRVARFWPHGHTPGAMQAPIEPISADHPYTLDLRRNGDGVRA
jgi:uncharacterized protein (DUF2126 family)/transglutaminase-like putative cysteine protease